MLKPTGFWSYSSFDDEAAGGRLSQLRALLARELQLKIGSHPKVHIFQDVSAIPPGARWEKQIREAIDDSSFLIPIVRLHTCRASRCYREMTLFQTRQNQLGRDKGEQCAAWRQLRGPWAAVSVRGPWAAASVSAAEWHRTSGDNSFHPHKSELGLACELLAFLARLAGAKGAGPQPQRRR
jgi:hypothetical protein